MVIPRYEMVEGSISSRSSDVTKGAIAPAREALDCGARAPSAGAGRGIHGPGQSALLNGYVDLFSTVAPLTSDYRVNRNSIATTDLAEATYGLHHPIHGVFAYPTEHLVFPQQPILTQ